MLERALLNWKFGNTMFNFFGNKNKKNTGSSIQSDRISRYTSYLKSEKFRKLEVRGSITVLVFKNGQDTKPKIEVTCSAEQFNSLRIMEDDATLSIEQEHLNGVPSINVISLFVNSIEEVSIEGSGGVQVRMDGVAGFEVAGSGNIQVYGKPADKVITNVKGSGDILFSKAIVAEAELYLVGSGNIDASKLHAHTLIATVCGSGNISASTTTLLSKTITGSGSIEIS